MSDYFVKIISNAPYYQINKERVQAIEDYLNSTITADNITAVAYETPVFADCGRNLEHILCPLCGEPIDFEWWGTAMEAAFKRDFEILSVTLPCCGGVSSLNDLQYDFPCGFTCIEFIIRNPLTELTNDMLVQIQNMIGSRIRIIHSHL